MKAFVNRLSRALGLSPPAPPPPVIVYEFGKEAADTLQAISRDVEDRTKFASQLVHVEQLSSESYRASYNASVLRVVTAMLEDIRTETRQAPLVLDFGCWSGATTRYISDVLGVGCVGAEINPLCLEFGRAYLANSRISFVEVGPNRIHCEDQSFDAVLANAVFCNMFPAQHEVMLREIIRVVKPGGAIIIIDSNNPDSPEVRSRLVSLYHFLEGESGSYLAARRAYIDGLRPETAPNIEAALATCYCTTQDIAEYLAGKRAASYFDANSMIAPYALSAPLGAPSTITDHKLYSAVMERAGLAIVSGPGYPPVSKITTESSFVLIGKAPLL